MRAVQLKTLSLVLLLLLSALLGIIVVRTAQFHSRQFAPEAPAALALDGSVVERLAQALRYRTISAATANSAAEFSRFHSFLENAFPRIHRTLTRESIGTYSLLFTWPGSDGGRDPILLLGHIDVVAAEAAGERSWRYPPFAGTVAEGYVWGRGALDDKASVLGILEAIEHLLAENFRPARSVLLAFGHDEETGGENGAARIAALLQQRNIRPAFVLDEGSAITRGILPGVQAPMAMIGIGEKGYLTLELTVTAPGGHTSIATGASAIGVLSAALARLEQHSFPARIDGAMRDFFNFAGPELPIPERALLANLWLFAPVIKQRLGNAPPTDALLRTTHAITGFEAGAADNVLPTRALAVVNLRLLTGDTTAEITDRVKRIIDDPRVVIRELPGKSEPSPLAPTDNAAFRLIQRTIRQVEPRAIVAPFLTMAATDARHYGKLTSNVYRFSPLTIEGEDLRRFHGIDERIGVEDYLRVVRFYAQLFRNAAGPAR
jgi:carboxypeptidase PM20D1